MTFLLLACVLCSVYFIILFSKKVDFCIIWLINAFLLGGIWGYLKLSRKNPAVSWLPGFFVISAAVILGILFLSFLIIEGKIIHSMYHFTSDEPDCVIVLGCQVKKKVPSKALKLRLDTALRYSNSHPKIKMILSGGKGDGEEISEALCMYQYLTAHGISHDHLYLEDRSTTTKENLLFSKELISKEFLSECATVALISNNFHIYRAVKLAKKLGYQKVFGVAAPTNSFLLPHYMVREYFAVIKGIF